MEKNAMAVLGHHRYIKPLGPTANTKLPESAWPSMCVLYLHYKGFQSEYLEYLFVALLCMRYLLCWSWDRQATSSFQPLLRFKLLNSHLHSRHALAYFLYFGYIYCLEICILSYRHYWHYISCLNATTQFAIFWLFCRETVVKFWMQLDRLLITYSISVRILRFLTSWHDMCF